MENDEIMLSPCHSPVMYDDFYSDIENLINQPDEELFPVQSLPVEIQVHQSSQTYASISYEQINFQSSHISVNPIKPKPKKRTVQLLLPTFFYCKRQKLDGSIPSLKSNDHIVHTIDSQPVSNVDEFFNESSLAPEKEDQIVKRKRGRPRGSKNKIKKNCCSGSHTAHDRQPVHSTCVSLGHGSHDATSQEFLTPQFINACASVMAMMKQMSTSSNPQVDYHSKLIDNLQQQLNNHQQLINSVVFGN